MGIPQQVQDAGESGESRLVQTRTNRRLHLTGGIPWTQVHGLIKD